MLGRTACPGVGTLEKDGEAMEHEAEELERVEALEEVQRRGRLEMERGERLIAPGSFCGERCSLSTSQTNIGSELITTQDEKTSHAPLNIA